MAAATIRWRLTSLSLGSRSLVRFSMGLDLGYLLQFFPLAALGQSELLGGFGLAGLPLSPPLRGGQLPTGGDPRALPPAGGGAKNSVITGSMIAPKPSAGP